MIGIAVLAFFLIVLNIILWFVFLKRFKNLFSTKDIISSTRLEMTRMIDDVNHNTARDINLIDSKIKELRAMSAEVDRKIIIMKSEIEKTAQSAKLQSVINESRIASAQKKSAVQTNPAFQTSSSSPTRPANPHITPVKRAAERYVSAGMGLQSQNSYTVTTEGAMLLEDGQGDLFNQEEKTYIQNPQGTKFTVETDGTTIASIPQISTEISYLENPIQPKDAFNRQVMALYNQGLEADQIARELNRTITEIQLVIDMGI